MSTNKGREQFNAQFLISTKEKLRVLQSHYQERVNPSISMSGIVELLIQKDFRAKKLSLTKAAEE